MANQDPGMSGSQIMYPVPVSPDTSTGMIPAQPMAMPPQGYGMGAPRGPEILHGSFNQTWLMNCLRRRWLLALCLGVLATAATAAVLLLLFPESSKVTAYLQVQSKPAEKLFGQQQRMSHQEFEIFQQTQLALLKSHFVLQTALGRSDVSQLDAVQKEEDAVQWLIDEMKVSFPGEGEILEIRYDGEENPEELLLVIDAVVDAYQKEVLYKENARQNELRDKLMELHSEVEKELADKMEEYEKLVKQIGGIKYDPTAATEVSLLTKEIGMVMGDIQRTKQELVDIEVNKTLALQALTSSAAMEAAISEALESDPQLEQYEIERFALDSQLRELTSRSRRKTPEAKNVEARLRQLSAEAQQYRIQAEQELRAKMKTAPNDQVAQVKTEYVLRRGEALQRLQQFEERLAEMKEEISDMGDSSSNLAILEREIEQEQELEREMDMRIRSWDTEEKAGGERIRVMQRATANEQINKMQRLAIAGIGGMAAFCATAYGVALLEFQRRRLNGPTDLDEGLGIRVLGVLPSVTSAKSLAPGNVTAAQVSEAIDNVRATLLHDSAARDRQVILVTSPVTLEGCTTVSSHLALSLTRAGRRTLLIDGDLRSPSLHKLFGMPLEDGLSEVLRSDIDIADAVKPTNTEGLWLLSAGHCDMDAIHALATEQPQPIFEKLRAEFDYIVIDGAPVLGLSDTVSLGQLVDGAILTVLRDHSEIRQIHKAIEMLRGMGVKVLGSVINGVRLKSDRRVVQIHKAAAQKAKQIASEKA
ncbi:MAG: polysaccharide biosynthesis tyrosine autokinase [Planctomycetota bacterium]